MITFEMGSLRVTEVAELRPGDFFAKDDSTGRNIGLVTQTEQGVCWWVLLTGQNPFTFEGNASAQGRPARVRCVLLPLRKEVLKLRVDPSSLLRTNALERGQLVIAEGPQIIVAVRQPHGREEEELIAISLKDFSEHGVERPSHVFTRWELIVASEGRPSELLVARESSKNETPR
ncbi:MAG: hypothetical protein ACTHJG_02110 [Rhodanobacteraceae bacterium]